MGVMLAKIPCICPWDVNYGEQFDVLQHGPVLLALAEAHRISSAHLGTPCQSLTWRRLPVLRAWHRIQGRPSLLQHEQELVTNGNELVLFTGTFILALHKAKAYFPRKILHLLGSGSLNPLKSFEVWKGSKWCSSSTKTLEPPILNSQVLCITPLLYISWLKSIMMNTDHLFS